MSTQPTATRTTRPIYKHTLQLVCLLCLTAPTVVSHAQSEERQPSEARLTDRGRIELGGSVQGLLDGNQADFEWCVSAWPEAMYFVLDRLGVGARVGGGYSTTPVLGEERTTWEAGILLGINYEVRLWLDRDRPWPRHLARSHSFAERAAGRVWVVHRTRRCVPLQPFAPGAVRVDRSRILRDVVISCSCRSCHRASRYHRRTELAREGPVWQAGDTPTQRS